MPAGLRRRAKFHCLGFRYVGQNRKNMEFCGKNLPLRVGGSPITQFLQNLTAPSCKHH